MEATALDSFCAMALLLGVPPEQVEAALAQAAPPWLARYRGASGSQGRAAQMAPRLLALRIAVERGRVRWG